MSRTRVNTTEAIYATIEKEPIYETPKPRHTYALRSIPCSVERTYAALNEVTKKKEYRRASESEHWLAVINVTGDEREEDFQLALKHGIISSNATYMKDFIPKDLLNIYMRPKTLAITMIEEITTTETAAVDGYLNEGGRKGTYYIRFRLMMTTEPYRPYEHTNRTYERSRIYYEGNIADCILSQTDDWTSCNMGKQVISKWFTENRPELRATSYRFMMVIIMITWTNFYRLRLDKNSMHLLLFRRWLRSCCDDPTWDFVVSKLSMPIPSC